MNFDDKFKSIISKTEVPEELLPENIKKNVLSYTFQEMNAENFLKYLKYNSISLSLFVKTLEFLRFDERVINVIKTHPQITANELLSVLNAAKFSEYDFAKILSTAIKIKEKKIETDPANQQMNEQDTKKQEIPVVPPMLENAIPQKGKKQKSRFGLLYKSVAVIAAVAVFVVGIFVYTDLFDGFKDKRNFITAADSKDKEADDYDLLFNKVKDFYNIQNENRTNDTEKNVGVDYNTDGATDSANGDKNESSEGKGNNFNSDTLNQVKNIQEADIIQFDGRRFYFANNVNDSIKVMLIEGDELVLEHELMPSTDKEFYVKNLIITDSRLAIVYLINDRSAVPNDTVKRGSFNDSIYYDYYYDSYVCVDVYDIKKGDFSKPVSIYSQKGTFTDLRVNGDYMYLLSEYAPVISGTVDKTEFVNTVPSYIQNSEECRLAPVDIIIPAEINDISYTMISGLDLNNKNPLVSIKADLSHSENIYVNSENIYLSAFLEKYESHKYTVETVFTKISYKKGVIDVIAKEFVDGYVHNQFSMDEYNGYFRAVTTTVDNHEGPRQTILYVFDKNMKVVSTLDGIGIGENVKSVRFDNEMAYIVTFLQVDPLFSIDLSNPLNPVLKDGLKIPGYSTYMQKWNDDLLLGFGVNATDNGIEIGLKLSMFDVKDSTNLVEKHKFEISQSDIYAPLYSQAVSDRKALYVSASNNLIGIPYTYKSEITTEYAYSFYSYDKNDGFKEIGKIVATDGSEIKRGGLNGDYFYLFSSKGAFVVDISDFSVISKLNFN